MLVVSMDAPGQFRRHLDGHTMHQRLPDKSVTHPVGAGLRKPARIQPAGLSRPGCLTEEPLWWCAIRASDDHFAFVSGFGGSYSWLNEYTESGLCPITAGCD